MHYDNLTLLAPFHFRPRDVKRAFELLAAATLGAGRIINAHRPLADLNEVVCHACAGCGAQVCRNSVSCNGSAVAAA